MKLRFEKWQACGNDYVFFDFLNVTQRLEPEFPSKEWISAISDRRSALGSDGVILILPPENPEKTVARMRMFNADGSEAQMCGNGIRSLAAIVNQQNPELQEFRVETLAGLRSCKILDHQGLDYRIEVNMGRPSFLPGHIPVLFDDVMVINEDFDVEDRSFQVSCVSMGNPHCVIEVKDLENFPVERFGPLIEKHEVFPEGVNVEFIEKKDDLVFQRTWERGSGETKACGTGACAVGVTMIMRNRIDSPVNIQLRGGELKVTWDGLREVFLEGAAGKEFSGSIEWEPHEPQKFELIKNSKILTNQKKI